MADELRPLVIVGIGGGLEQWSIIKPGTGMPNQFTLDYDREGQTGDELRDFADEITEAMIHLAAFGDPEDDEAIANMADSIAEYRRLAHSGEPAGRYR